jgi:hypothetical protein
MKVRYRPVGTQRSPARHGTAWQERRGTDHRGCLRLGELRARGDDPGELRHPLAEFALRQRLVHQAGPQRPFRVDVLGRFFSPALLFDGLGLIVIGIGGRRIVSMGSPIRRSGQKEVRSSRTTDGVIRVRSKSVDRR